MKHIQIVTPILMLGMSVHANSTTVLVHSVWTLVLLQTRQLLVKYPGVVVYGTARNPDASPGLQALKRRHPVRCELATMDVTKEDTIEVEFDYYGMLEKLWKHPQDFCYFLQSPEFLLFLWTPLVNHEREEKGWINHVVA